MLSPTRKGETGTVAAEPAFAGGAEPAVAGEKSEGIRRPSVPEGDRVMQTRNNYDVLWEREDGTAGTGIFNGDVGVIEDIDPAGELITIRFDGRVAVYTADLLGQLDLAYAITVHKAQGSEYRAVILLTAPTAPALMVRGVLYTAITRARNC